MVPRMVRPCAAAVGDRTRKGIDGPFIHPRLDLRRRILFRNVLVANLCPDHLRRLPAAASLFPPVLRHVRRGDLSSDLRSGNVDLSPPIRYMGISTSPICLGVH